MSDILIVVRVMPAGEEHDVELSRYSTGQEIKDALLDEGIAPKSSPEGNLYTYDLVAKQNNVKIGNQDTLDDLGIRNGETLLFIPALVAGA